MKRLVLMVIPALICGLVLTSCNKGIGETPSCVAEKICKAYTSKDWTTYFKYLYLDIAEEEKETMLNEWYEATGEIDPNPCVKYEIFGEWISNDGQKAQVKVKFFFKDGTEKTNENLCFTKTDDGWRMLRFTAERCLI